MSGRDLPPDEVAPRTGRDRRAQLEHVLFEEVGQELRSILSLVIALHTAGLSAADVASGLERVADQISAAIGHCTTAASYFDQRLLPVPGRDSQSRNR